jgi:hypothetical protein
LYNVISDGVYIATLDSVKYLEYDNAYITYINDDDFPDKDIFTYTDLNCSVYVNNLKFIYIVLIKPFQKIISPLKGAEEIL